MKRRGDFIVFEGLNGSGKTTQLKKLAAHIYDENKDNTLFLTREPNIMDLWGREARRIITEKRGNIQERAEELTRLFSKSRREHGGLIGIHLGLGSHTLCDRYWGSTIAYQNAQGIPFETIAEYNKENRTPDLTYLIKVSPETALQRQLTRGENLRKFEGNKTFQEKVARNYNHLGRLLKEHLGDESVVIINGEQNEEKVFHDILKDYETYFIDGRREKNHHRNYE